MQKLQTSTLLKKKYTFKILDAIETQIDITKNPFHLSIEDLFTMAARINKKRSFLFVSKVLGKHIPINPHKGLLTSALLAMQYAETVKGITCQEKERLLSSFEKNQPFRNTAFIPPSVHPLIFGFAETATALGHAFFDCFTSADYFHTTREVISNRKPEITFEEEHSHATSHRLYIPKELIQNNREIILVDDEMTTGKSALNMIQSIHEQFPRQVYTVVSILDWRSKENIQKFNALEEKLGITIHAVSLISGEVKVKQIHEITEKLAKNEMNKIGKPLIEMVQLSSFFSNSDFPFIQETGRFGINSGTQSAFQQKISAAAAFLREKRSGKKTLCLGTGEFMYIPMRLAAELGEDVSYQSTTRSPIHIVNGEGYGARYGIIFPNPEEPEVTHFVYNIPPGFYDEMIIFFERKVEPEYLTPLLMEFEKLQLQSIKLVFFSE